MTEFINPTSLEVVITDDAKVLQYEDFVKALFKPLPIEMMKAHAAMLVAGEAGELLDCIKKEVIYNKPLDKDNLVEELGDLAFGIQAVLNLYELRWSDVIQANYEKLKARYPSGTYTDKDAIARADKSTGE